MSKARLIITAVVVERRSKSEVSRDYDVSRYWVQQQVKRWYAEGEAAYQPRSRRPRHSPHAVPSAVEDEIVRLRKELTRQGLDAGADTIRSHLARRAPGSAPEDRSPADPGPPDLTGIPAVSTIWRILTRRGFVTPSRASAPGRGGAPSPPSSPTNAGRPTPPTGSWPTAPRWRSSTSSTKIRIVDTTTGELLRELTLDPTRRYQPIR